MAIVLNIIEDNQLICVTLNNEDFTIGRSPKCDLQIKDPTCSSKHLAIKLVEGKTVVRDLDSRNGSFMNGLKIEETYFSTGAHLRIGKIQMFLDEGRMTSPEKKMHGLDQEPGGSLVIDVKEGLRPATNHQVQISPEMTQNKIEIKRRMKDDGKYSIQEAIKIRQKRSRQENLNLEDQSECSQIRPGLLEIVHKVKRFFGLN